MVSIRYHIITLVAVFLALGIGVVVGSTVVDQALVDDLENRVDSLEDRLSDARTENENLQGRLDALQQLDDGLTEEGPDTLLAGELTGVPVLVVGVEGIDEAPVDDLRSTVDAAGGIDQGTVWLTERLALPDEDASTALSEIVGDTGGTAETLRQQLGEDLATSLLSASELEPSELSTNSSNGSNGATVASEATALNALLDDLAEAGFVRLDGTPDPDERDLSGVRVVVVSGTGSRLAHDVFAHPFVEALAADGVAPVVVAEATTAITPPATPDGATAEPAPRGAFVAGVRDDSTLRDRVSTVDDLEVFAGRAATVLAVQDLAAGTVGHYGVGEGADGLLPEP